MSHYIEVCVHGYTHGQCRCFDHDKNVRLTECQWPHHVQQPHYLDDKLFFQLSGRDQRKYIAHLDSLGKSLPFLVVSNGDDFEPLEPKPIEVEEVPDREEPTTISFEYSVRTFRHKTELVIGVTAVESNEGGVTFFGADLEVIKMYPWHELLSITKIEKESTK